MNKTYYQQSSSDTYLIYDSPNEVPSGFVPVVGYLPCIYYIPEHFLFSQPTTTSEYLIPNQPPPYPCHQQSPFYPQYQPLTTPHVFRLSRSQKVWICQSHGFDSETTKKTHQKTENQHKVK